MGRGSRPKLPGRATAIECKLLVTAEACRYCACACSVTVSITVSSEIEVDDGFRP